MSDEIKDSIVQAHDFMDFAEDFEAYCDHFELPFVRYGQFIGGHLLCEFVDRLRLELVKE
jgi:hypothetical protein